ERAGSEAQAGSADDRPRGQRGSSLVRSERDRRGRGEAGGGGGGIRRRALDSPPRRPSLMLLAALAPALAVLFLQAAPSSKAVDAENERFLGLETRVSGAIQMKNSAALEGLLAKDFTFSLALEGRPPEIMSREEWLKATEYYTLTGFEI